MQELSLPCQDSPPPDVGAAPRRATRSVAVKWGERIVHIGGQAPVVVQSMTNTDTADPIDRHSGQGIGARGIRAGAYHRQYP